jgi:hypothetical protein
VEICGECRERLPQGADRCPSCGRPVTVAYLVGEGAEPGWAGGPRRGRRLVGWGAVGLVAAALVWGATRGPSGGGPGGSAEPVGGPEAGATGPGPGPTVTVAPRPATLGFEGRVVLTVQDGQGHRGLVLLDLRDGSWRPLALRGPRPGAPLTALFVHEGFLVVQGQRTAWSVPTGAIGALRSPPAFPLGSADAVLPRGRGRVWAVLRLGPDRWAARARGLTGEPGGPFAALPARFRPVAGFDGGLVGVRDGAVALWLPRFGRSAAWSGPSGPVLAGRWPLVAWLAAGCAERSACPLHLADLSSGEETTIAGPRPVRGFTGPAAFSGDGRLAVFARLPGGGAALAVVEALAQPRGVALSVGPAWAEPAQDCSPCLAWFPAGRALVFLTARGDLLLSRVGDGLTLEVPLPDVGGRVVGVVAL